MTHAHPRDFCTPPIVDRSPPRTHTIDFQTFEFYTYISLLSLSLSLFVDEFFIRVDGSMVSIYYREFYQYFILNVETDLREQVDD